MAIEINIVATEDGHAVCVRHSKSYSLDGNEPGSRTFDTGKPTVMAFEAFISDLVENGLKHRPDLIAIEAKAAAKAASDDDDGYDLDDED